LRTLYTILYLIALIFLLPFEFLKRPADLRLRWLKEKFGVIHPPLNPPSYIKRGEGGVTSDHRKPCLWIHAVSVGETLAARGIVERLRREFPHIPIIFSTMTDTGQQTAMREFKGITVVYMPFDIGFILKRLFRRLNIALFITVETEFWPNTFYILRRLGIPLIVVNARLSEKSFKGYKKVRFFMRDVLASVSAFCAGSPYDAERLKALGVPEGRIQITGNLKFDMPPPEPLNLTFKNDLNKCIIVIGSTHPGEEGLILQALNNLIMSGKIYIVLAPRHPQRFKEVEEVLRRRGIRFVKRSEIGAHKIVDLQEKDLMLLDTLGELSSFYSIADIAIVGGSFVPVGGHNLLEPAYWSKPVICGKHMDNFPLVEEFLREGAALMVEEGQIEEVVSELINSPKKRADLGQRAKEIYERNRGALERTISVIKQYL
jgi:3-deoxy-D-manno-octulosonic-acid transferase